MENEIGHSKAENPAKNGRVDFCCCSYFVKRCRSIDRNELCDIESVNGLDCHGIEVLAADQLRRRPGSLLSKQKLMGPLTAKLLIAFEGPTIN